MPRISSKQRGQSKRTGAKLTALATSPDILRLTSLAGNKLSESWSIPPELAGATTPAEGLAGHSLRFQSRTGAWTLASARGWEVLRCERMTAGASPAVIMTARPADQWFGLGSGVGPLDRRGTRREIWNIDVLGHASGIHPLLRNLYAGIPFALLLREGRALGLFWDHPARQQWDFDSRQEGRLEITADSGPVNLYVLLGPTPAEVLEQFTRLTGRTPLPPRWALGYQQSRYSYRTRAELEAVAREFRRRQIPCDVLHLDIHHLRGYRVFTFGKEFPRPAEMLRSLARKGFKVAAIVDPGVKDDPRFAVLKRGLARKAFIKKPGGRGDFTGEVWPGASRFPDFTNAAVRDWWAGEQARFQQLGLAGFWNDMNEPAIFDGPGKTLPPDCPHRTDFGTASHGEMHNLYGLQMARASQAGALRHAPGERPFIISRGGWAGIQRHAAVWTGDNSSCWEHLAESVPMLLNLGLSGVPFCGADAGGFLGDCSPELLARWTQLAAFTPFFRNHSNLDSRRQEPWAFGPGVEEICRRHIKLRYQLLPYLCCLLAEARRTGAPLMRPLFWHHAGDANAAACGDQFLLGPDVLVAPVVQPAATARVVYLPRGVWFDFWSGEPREGGQHIAVPTTLATMPVFLRGGGILPMAPDRQWIDPRKPDREITLHAWLGGRGNLRWHEDDGHSQRYLAGDIHERDLELVDNGDRGSLRFSAATGAFASRVKLWRILLRGCSRKVRVRLNNRPWPAHLVPEISAMVIDLPNTADEMTLTWR